MITNERGIALVITLLVVALLTITVIEFTYSAQVDQHMARNALSGLQASLLARSGINLGEAFLLHDQDEKVDAFTEEWCPDPSSDGRACRIDESTSQILLPQNLRLRVQIIDEGGKLNINSIGFPRPADWRAYRDWVSKGSDPNKAPPTESWRAAFERLLSSRSVDPAIAGEVLQYWDQLYEVKFGPPPLAPSPGATQVPSPAATAPAAGSQPSPGFQSLDDASVIPSLSPSVIRRLRPVLTALPNPANPPYKVNANTAPREVLHAILEDEGVVDQIVSQRSEAPLPQGEIIKIAQSLNSKQPATPNFAFRSLVAKSSYFLVRATAVVNPNPVTGRGGISRSATMLVERKWRTVPQGGSASAVPWTLKQLDWQKEGGAGLFQPQGEQEPGADELTAAGAPG